MKIVRDKTTHLNLGYGFIDFSDRETAESVLRNLNGKEIPNTGTYFRLNWGVQSGTTSTVAKSQEYSVFVGDLGGDVTDVVLLKAFKARFASVCSAKVIMDPMTGHSRGYGFVGFANRVDQQSALTTMTGTLVGSKQIRVNVAAPPKPNGGIAQGHLSSMSGTAASSLSVMKRSETVNTTVFVGGIHHDEAIDETKIRQHFSSYGDITEVRIPATRGCAFVVFRTHAGAERAIQMASGTTMGSSSIRCSWGRSKQPSPAVVQHMYPPSMYNTSVAQYPSISSFAPTYNGSYQNYAYHNARNIASSTSSSTVVPTRSSQKVMPQTRRVRPDADQDNVAFMKSRSVSIVSCAPHLHARHASSAFESSSTATMMQGRGNVVFRTNVKLANDAFLRPMP